MKVVHWCRMLCLFLMIVLVAPSDKAYAAGFNHFEINLVGNDIKARVCGQGFGLTIRIEEITPQPNIMYGRYDPAGLNGCRTFIVVVSAVIGAVYEFGLIAGGDGNTHDISQFYQITRTGERGIAYWPVRGPEITNIEFRWSRNFGGSIIASYCAYGKHYWITSTDLNEDRMLGQWNFHNLNRCESRYVVTGVGSSGYFLIQLGAGNGGLFTGSKSYRVFWDGSRLDPYFEWDGCTC